MRGQEIVYNFLEDNGINYNYIEHPEAPTIEIAKQYARGEDVVLCKNLFFRNHKGNKHYLVIMNANYQMDIHDIEKRLGQGKLSFASPERMMKYLGVKPGSVSLFTLLNDTDSEVILFVDESLKNCKNVSFHPNNNTASLVITVQDMLKFIDLMKNKVEFLQLY